MPSYKELDFGPVAQKYDHRKELTLVNLNPIPLFIQKIRPTQVSCDNEVVSFKDSQSNRHNFIELIPKTTIDIFSGKIRRDFRDEDKLFNQIYNPKQDKEIKVMISESSDFIIPANGIVKFDVRLKSPKIRSGSKCHKFEAKIYFVSFQAPNFNVPITYKLYNGDMNLYPSDIVRFPPSISGEVKTKNISIRQYKLIDTSSREKLDYITLESSFSHNNLNGNSKDDEPVLTYFDIFAWQVEQKQWDNKDFSKRADTGSIITIDTNMVQNITIPVNSGITKPSLLSQDVYEFDKIEVGTEKRGSITIHNPSPDPLEVSFNIAPSNFMENIINTILSIENRPKWEIICNKTTFFDLYGRDMCISLNILESLSESKRKIVIDYFIQNYFTFILMGDSSDIEIKEFIANQKAFLKQSVQNITDATNSAKPSVKTEKLNDDFGIIFQRFLNKLYNKLAGYFEYNMEDRSTDADREIFEEIKVRIHKYIDEEHIHEELKSMIDIFRGNFYLEHTPN